VSLERHKLHCRSRRSSCRPSTWRIRRWVLSAGCASSTFLIPLQGFHATCNRSLPNYVIGSCCSLYYAQRSWVCCTLLFPPVRSLSRFEIRHTRPSTWLHSDALPAVSLQLERIPLPSFCAVPVVVGNNKDEGNLITIVQFPPDSVVPQNLSNYIQRIAPPPYNVTVASQYDLSRYTPFGAISTIVTDQQFLCRSERALRVLAQAGIEVYRFVFTQVFIYLFVLVLYAGVYAA
jgi:hypothetical protein